MQQPITLPLDQKYEIINSDFYILMRKQCNKLVSNSINLKQRNLTVRILTKQITIF